VWLSILHNVRHRDKTNMTNIEIAVPTVDLFGEELMKKRTRPEAIRESHWE
jgi:hypothetical protein